MRRTTVKTMEMKKSSTEQCPLTRYLGSRFLDICLYALAEGESSPSGEHLLRLGADLPMHKGSDAGSGYMLGDAQGRSKVSPVRKKVSVSSILVQQRLRNRHRNSEERHRRVQLSCRHSVFELACLQICEGHCPKIRRHTNLGKIDLCFIATIPIGSSHACAKWTLPILSEHVWRFHDLLQFAAIRVTPSQEIFARANGFSRVSTNISTELISWLPSV